MTAKQLQAWVKANITAENAEIELYWRWARHMCRTNLWFLSYEVLEYRDLDHKFHGRMCDRLQRWPMRDDLTPYPYQADAWPRGGFKTTLATVARSIQIILCCQEETFLIQHGEKDQAKAILSEIKGHLAENELLKWLFPDVLFKNPKNDSETWTREQATVRRSGIYKEATFEVASADSDSTGGHYTVLIFDDLVTAKNVSTPEQIEKVHRHFRITSGGPFQDQRWIKPGDARWKDHYRQHQFWNDEKQELQIPHRTALIFTRWDANDSNSRVIDPKNASFQGKVDVCIERAWNPDTSHPEGGWSFFPKKFPKWKLQDIAGFLGPSSFSAQYQQDPYPADAQILKKEYIQYYRPVDLVNMDLEYYTAIDPNIKSDDPSADWGVIMTVGVDVAGNFYIIRISRGRFTPEEQIQNVLQHNEMFEPRVVCFEIVGAQQILLNMLMTKAKSLGMRIPIHKVTRGGTSSAQNKNRRILATEPIYAAKRVFLPKGIPTTEDFVEEMLRWNPIKKKQQDDQLDAFADIVTVATGVTSRLQRMKKPKEEEVDLTPKPGTIAAGTGDRLLSMVAPGRQGWRSRRSRR